MFVAKIVLLLFIASSFYGVDSKLTVYDENQKASTIDTLLINAVRWDITNELNEQFPTQNATTAIPLIDISKSYGDYDVCDERTLNAIAIESLILSKGFNPAEKWIAVIDWKVVTEPCQDSPFPVMAPILSLIAQNLGANGLVLSGNGEMKFFFAMENVDAVKKEVYGVNIRIPVLTFGYSERRTTINTTSPIYIYSKNDIQVDQDPLNEVYTPYGITRLVSLVIGFGSMAVMVFITTRTRKVVKYFENKNEYAQRKQLQLRWLILIPEFISCFVRFIACFDHEGIVGYLTQSQYWRLVFLELSISASTDIVLIFYCLDVFYVFKGSRRMKRITPFVIKYKFAIQIIMSIGFGMVFLNQIAMVMAENGMIGSRAHEVLILYILVVTVIVIFTLGMISTSMIREVYKSFGNSTSTSGQTSKMVQNILEMRRNILGTIICRLLLLGSWVSFGFYLQYSDTTIYILTMVAMSGSGTLSSYLQVLSASAVVEDSTTSQRTSITKVSVSSSSSSSSVASSKLSELSESTV